MLWERTEEDVSSWEAGTIRGATWWMICSFDFVRPSVQYIEHETRVLSNDQSD